MIFKIIEWFLILGFVLTVIGLKFLWPWPLIMGIALLGSLPMLTVVSLFFRD